MNNFNNFLSHLNSFGSKQQPKPGLWVNGNSMPKSSLNEMLGFMYGDQLRQDAALAAMNSPDATSETVSQYLNDSDLDIRDAARNHPLAPGRPLAGGPLASHNAGGPLAAMNSPDATSRTVSQYLNHKDLDVARTARNHPLASHNAADRLQYIKGFHDTNSTDSQVAMAALNSPDASNETTLDYAKHSDPQVAIAAVNHPMATSQTVDIASTHPDASVVMAALNNPMATSYTTHNAVGHPNPDVAMAALNHPEADGGTIMYGKQHPDSKVVAAAIGHRLRDGRAPESSLNEMLGFMYDDQLRQDAALAAMNSPDATSETVSQYLNDKDLAVARTARNHPLAPGGPLKGRPLASHNAADRLQYIKDFHDTNSTDSQVAMAALNSPDASNETTLDYAKHSDPQVAIAAVNHPMATSQTVDIASTHPDASVVMAALNNPMATSYTTHNAVGHPNPDVAMAALNHPEADGGTIMYGKQHPDSKVVAAAIGHPISDTQISDDQIMKREIEKGNFMYLNHRLRGGKAPDSNPAPQNDLTPRHPIQENTRRSIFLNHLNSFSNNIQEQRKLTRYEQGAIERARIKKENDMAEFDKTLDALPTRMPANLRIPPARPTGSPKYVPPVRPPILTTPIDNTRRPEDTETAMEMLNGPFNDGVNQFGIPAQRIVNFAAHHKNPAIALAALNHPLATEETAEIARSHPDSDVREAAASFIPRQTTNSFPPSTFAAAEASRQRFPRIDTGARDINGDPIKPAPTPGETAFKQWIRSF